jgi:predicted DNA-binding protein
MRGNLREYMIRLPPEEIEKLRKLKELGFSPSAILRSAAMQAIREKLEFAKRMQKREE